MSDTLVRTVGPNAAKKAIRKAFKSKRPIFLWGSMGLGKSDIIKQIADDLGAPTIDVRLSLMDPTDIKGIPYHNKEQNTMVWAQPSEFPTQEYADQYKHVVLFLDEMNSAAPSVQAAAYQLILNRRVGQYVLPDNVVIVAAGNRDGDKGVTYKMPAPLANRFIHLELAVDFDDWFQWATDHKIHQDVVGFITANKGDLSDFDSKSSSKAFATPRSWSFVSELLTDDDTDEATLVDLISGTVGDGLAVKFMAHRKFASKLPNPVDILAGKVTRMETTEISAMYSLAVSLCYELKESSDKKVKNYDEQCERFFAFILDNFEAELIILATKIALCNYKIAFNLDKCPSFDRLYKDYSKYTVQN